MHRAVFPLGLLFAACGGPAAAAPAAAAAPGPAPETPAAAATPAPPPSCPDTPGLCLRIEPGDAELVVDGKSRGSVAGLGAAGHAYLALEPGIHQIVLSREGYLTWRAEVSIGSAPESIEVGLEPLKP